MFQKEIFFEGYFVADYETAFLSKEPEYSYKGKGGDYMRRWFRNYLKQRLQEKPEKEPTLVSLEDILPKQVLEKLLKNPNAKFQFKIVVNVEEVFISTDY